MEENNSLGFIKVQRKLFDGWIWEDAEPFDKRSAWIDLLRSARWQAEPWEKEVGNAMVEIKRGQLHATYRFLATRWKWKNISKVEAFVKKLKERGMIEVDKRTGETIITICKYNDYNGYKDGERTVNGIEPELKRNPNGNETDKLEENQENKKLRKQEVITPAVNPPGATPDKNLERDFFELRKYMITTHVLVKIEQPMTQEQYSKLRETYTHEQIMEALELMENSKSSSKKTSVYLTCLYFCKSNFGNSDIAKCIEDFEKTYREFVETQTGAQARLDKFEKRAMRGIIGYLLENNPAAIARAKAANEPDKIFTDVPGAIARWQGILNSWGLLDTFMKNRIKLQEIDKDIIKILQHLKNHHANGKENTNVKGNFGTKGINTNDSAPKNFD